MSRTRQVETDADRISPIETQTSNVETRPLPELLAPAGDWDCAKAAVENGADAIYFGLDKFNARIRAANFTEADLPRLMEFLHRRGVKGYVTLNTLVFENELAEAEQYLRTIIAAGVDAVIVQDTGICRLIRRISPDFPIHASTQMTLTSAAGIEFARDLGCSLVVLARECSIKEIEKIQNVSCDNSQLSTLNSQLPLEVFVHGALCVAYSGQCLTSESLGGRSANRGECAQACRMPYDLVADGQPVPLGDRKYLLSPRDLAGLDLLPDLVRAGVASLKIEGRLKSPEYVANITRIYRKTLDDLRFTIYDLRAPGRSHGPADSSGRKSQIVTRKYEMEMAFSRGLHTGWLEGINNQELVHGRFGKKRGVYLGQVGSVRRESVVIRLEGPLKPGDGVVFDAGKPEEEEEGGRVYEVRRKEEGGRRKQEEGRRKEEARTAADNDHISRLTSHVSRFAFHEPVELKFGRGDINFSRIHPGDKVWKTSDPELDRRLRQSFAGDTPRFRRPVDFEVQGASGRPLTLLARDELGNLARADSSVPLVKAENQPLTTARLEAQLDRLGGTPFKLGTLKNLLPDGLMLPVSELNRLRRQAVAELERQRAQPKQWKLCHPQSPPTNLEPGTASPLRETRKSQIANRKLIVLVRNMAQLQAALEAGVETLYCDFEDPRKYPDAVAGFRSRRTPIVNRQSSMFVALPRVFKTGEEWTLKQVRSCEADGYLVRNYDHLKYFAGDRCVGDYSLNIANSIAADYFKNRFRLERVTASYDLNPEQLEALLQAAPPDWFEVVIHQHIPMFHMEHCVFCAFLSSGTDYTNCGRPCDRHDVKLRDRVGAEHPVKADAGCRNTVFNALAQTGAEHVSRLLSLGVRHFRIEFLNESPDQVRQTITKYGQLLIGEITGAQLWRELKLLNQLGVTRGQRR